MSENVNLDRRQLFGETARTNVPQEAPDPFAKAIIDANGIL